MSVSKVGEMGAIWTTTCAFAASTLGSVKMAGKREVARAQVHWSQLFCTVCAAVHRNAKPQRFSLQQLIILLTADLSRGQEVNSSPILVNSSNICVQMTYSSTFN